VLRGRKSKRDAELQCCLMSLEIHQVEHAGFVNGAACNLGAPGEHDPRALGELGIRRWTNEECVALETIEAQTSVAAKISRFSSNEDAGTNLHHERGGDTDCQRDGFCLARLRHQREMAGTAQSDRAPRDGAAILRDPTIAAGIGQLAAIQAVAPALGVELSPLGARDAGPIPAHMQPEPVRGGHKDAREAPIWVGPFGER
jgi:hypothetical protein